MKFNCFDHISHSKTTFNKFFHDDLYGKYDSDQNIILSRGGWEDNAVAYPKIFSFCINYSLKKHWAGYSDSLGHKNTKEALKKLVNLDFKPQQYDTDNLAITIGNVLTLGFVFRFLEAKSPASRALCLQPYYPPIVKSLSESFPNTYFVNSLGTEEMIIKDIKESVLRNDVKILLLTNAIGVEGRIFSKNYWSQIIDIVKKQDAYLIIDEGAWFERLPYPKEINSEKVIRLISLSKKYGIPGFKLGYMIGSKNFISAFYEQASTGYGGPPSIFFLLAEFIYEFEYIYFSKSNPDSSLKRLSKQYDIAVSKLTGLYKDFVIKVEKNRKHLGDNQNSFKKWAEKNHEKIDTVYDFGGINVLVKPKVASKAYDLFLKAIQSGVSIFPGLCIGDDSDSIFRITLLENRREFKKGLNTLSDLLNCI